MSFLQCSAPQTPFTQGKGRNPLSCLQCPFTICLPHSHLSSSCSVPFHSFWLMTQWLPWWSLNVLPVFVSGILPLRFSCLKCFSPQTASWLASTPPSSLCSNWTLDLLTPHSSPNLPVALDFFLGIYHCLIYYIIYTLFVVIFCLLWLELVH